MAKVDLHIHSNASDGRYSPAEIVRMAVTAGLTVIALTDHDTIDGLVPAIEAAREFPCINADSRCRTQHRYSQRGSPCARIFYRLYQTRNSKPVWSECVIRGLIEPIKWWQN